MRHPLLVSGWLDAAGAGPNAATAVRCPGAEDPPPRCAAWRASGTTKRSTREGGR